MKIIDNKEYYEIPNTNGRYYICIEGEVYSERTHRHLYKQYNQVQMTMNGVRGRYNTNKLLLLALKYELDSVKQEREKYSQLIEKQQKDNNELLNKLSDTMSKCIEDITDLIDKSK